MTRIIIRRGTLELEPDYSDGVKDFAATIEALVQSQTGLSDDMRQALRVPTEYLGEFREGYRGGAASYSRLDNLAREYAASMTDED